MLWHSEVIGDFVKTIFSLVQEGGHFLAKTNVIKPSGLTKNVHFQYFYAIPVNLMNTIA